MYERIYNNSTKMYRCILVLGIVLSVCSQAWISEPYRGKMLVQQPLPTFTQTDFKGIMINPNEVYQTIGGGFGWALTGGSAELIMQLPTDTKNKLLEQLFSNKGIGVSALRVSVGSSDLDSQPFTYDDMPNGQTDPLLKNFSLAKSQKYLIPLMKSILLINPKMMFLASPWSAPAWMKTSKSLKGGQLETQYYRNYAQYLVNYINAMKSHGIHIAALTPQNQPLYGGNNPSMVMTAQKQADFIKNYLGRAFAQNNINTKIIIYDHNCDNPGYPISILNDPEAKKYIAGSAFHLYSGTIDALSKVKNAHPDKALYFTEQWTSAKGDFAGDFMWHFKNVIIGSLVNHAQAIIEWNLANDKDLRPHTDGGCSECLGAITIDNGQVTRNQLYYIVAQASKFIPAGSKRINIQYLPNGVGGTACILPNLQIVVLLQNENDKQVQSSIIVGSKQVKISLPPKSAATYVLSL